MSEFQQHWLSAYLDNELSTAERALVERKLEEDSEARELLEDLKRVRGLVATLPSWGNQAFQFDMSRLNQSPADEDDLETDQSLNEPSKLHGDFPGTHTLPSVSAELDGSRHSGTRSKWRGLLALVAGLLLLVLCVPYFLSRYGDGIALGPEGGLGGGMGGVGGGGVGGGFGGVGQLDESHNFEMPEGRVAGDQKAAMDANEPSLNLDSDSRTLAAPMQPKLKNELAPPPGPRGIELDKPSLARSSDTAGVGGAMRDAGGAASRAMRGAAAPAMEPAPAAPKLDPLNRAMEQKKDIAPSADGQANMRSMVRSDLGQGYLLAKSDAWSENEVSQALPKLQTMLTADSTREETSVEAVDKARSAGNDQPSAPRELNELFLAELPKETDVDSWFAQIQASQSVVEVSNSHTRPLAESPASGNLELKAKQQKNADAVGSSHVLLFVTESQAKKIMASLPGRNADQFWRVIPAAEKLNEQASNEEKKVIVILNRTP